MSKEITLTKGYVTIVDDEDYERLSIFNWQAIVGHRGNVYAIRQQNGSVPMHREVLGLGKRGNSKLVVDHINGNSLDNRKENLRLCTHAENCRNRRGNHNKTGYKGVYKSKNRRGEWAGKWVANICYEYKTIVIGKYNTEIEAALAYNEMAKKLFGQFARLNEVPRE